MERRVGVVGCNGEGQAAEDMVQLNLSYIYVRESMMEWSTISVADSKNVQGSLDMLRVSFQVMYAVGLAVTVHESEGVKKFGSSKLVLWYCVSG